jgi:hypothetical protein
VIRKQFLSQSKFGIDLTWVTATLNLFHKLSVMFHNESERPNDRNVNLGFKYAFSGHNIWDNQFF